ncbi:MAG: carboxypeptidase regulatory-like domain-containing protein [Akkermansiaceae bacterium]|nr:carboxypeptidase regulatory-like domain-containing protein [Akkermansiaceae bacterium]
MNDVPLLPPDGVMPSGPATLGLPILASGKCVINGEVSDAVSLNPVVGAIVDLLGTGRTAETDVEGRFRFDGLPPGTYTLEVSKLGYSGETNVTTAIEGRPAAVRFGLRAKPVDDSIAEFTLEEETIVGEYTGDGTTALFTDLAVESTLSSGFSKDEFTKTGVSDAAGAVGKISGANIVGGKFAVVRGLADRYVTTLFNGAGISSADPSRKAVQLDIFPSTAIQGIDISKTYFPNLPGDFGGGTIRIKSLSIPQERIAEFKYKITWNSNLADRMLVHPDRGLGFWGDVNEPIKDSWMWNLNADGKPESFDTGGNRVVPGNTTNAAQRAAQIAEAQRQQELANGALPGQLQLHNSQSFMPKEVDPEEGHSWSMVYGDRFKFDNGNEAGFVAAFQHSTQDTVNPEGEENRFTSPARSWTEESYAREVDWSVYLSGGYKVGEDHEFTATYFKKRIASDEITHGTNFTIDGSDIYGSLARNDATIARYGASAVYKKEFWTIDPIIRDTEVMQLGGAHKNDWGTRLNWSLTRSSAKESRPHSSTFQNGILDFSDPSIAAAAANDPGIIYNPSLGQISTIEYQTFVNDGNGSQDSSRETQAIDEKALEMSADLTQAIYFSDDKEDGPKFEISFGGNKLTKDREQQGRVYLLKTASWERWIARNPPSWWPSDIDPFSPGSPLGSTTLPDGSPLPSGFNSVGEYLAANPDKIADYFNGYGGEGAGPVPGTGNTSGRANYVNPDAPYYVNGSGLEVRNVGSELTLTGLYATGVFYADNWRFGGGARWEEETKSYVVAPLPLTSLLPDSPARFGEVTTTAFIPSLIGAIDILDEKSWLNFAWSRTVARPTFHEFLPIESIAQDTGILRRGNPDLGETTIDNIDASVDYVFSESLRMTASVFSKKLSDPIVVVQRVDQGQNINTYINGDSGSIHGFELEGTWKGDGPFSINANYTFIASTLKYTVNQGINTTDLETRFPFQPGQIMNVTLGWEPVDSPWSAYLSTNFTDEYPTILRSDPNAYDVWQKPQLTMDLVVSRKIDLGILNGTVLLGFKNLLGTESKLEYRGDGDYDGMLYSVGSPGRSYSIEFKGTF